MAKTVRITGYPGELTGLDQGPLHVVSDRLASLLCS